MTNLPPLPNPQGGRNVGDSNVMGLLVGLRSEAIRMRAELATLKASQVTGSTASAETSSSSLGAFETRLSALEAALAAIGAARLVRAGENIGPFLPVAQDTGTGDAVLASNTEVDHYGHILGLTRNQVAAGQYADIAHSGSILMNRAWSFTPGAEIWLGAAGALVENDAGTGAFAQRLGIALTTNTMLVDMTPKIPRGVRLVADGGVTAFDLVATTAAGVEPASAATAGHFGKVVGIARFDAADTEDVDVVTSGDVIDNSAWSWTPGDLLWVSETGGAIGTTPIGVTDPKFYQLVGVALTATKVLVWIEEPVLIWTSDNADPTAEALENAAKRVLTSRPNGTREEYPLVELDLIGETEIKQSEDDAGLQITGFDDRAGTSIRAHITASGLARIIATGLLSFGGTRFLFGTTTDDGVNLGQFDGAVTTTGSYKVNGVQVVGGQLSDVGTGTASGASYSGVDNAQVGNVYATVASLNDLASRYDNLVTVVIAIRNRMQTHGLIA